MDSDEADRDDDDKKERKPLFPFQAFRGNSLTETLCYLCMVLWGNHKFKLLFCVVSCGAFYGVKSLRYQKSIHWEEGLLHNLPTCQKTNIQPFRDGCPATCQNYRPNEVIKTNTTRGIHEREQPLNHLSVFWAFGQPYKYENVGMGDLPETTAYDVGINYQCSEEFVRSFGHAVEHLNYEATDKIPGIECRGARRMQLDLMYLCCLTRSQAFMAQHLIQTWLYENYPFDISLQFDRLECWRTEDSHVTNMIMANDKTQRSLMRLNHELRDLLKDHDIPLWIERESQIPFHVPVGGISFRQRSDEDYRAKVIASIYNIVHQTSNHMEMSWTGKGQPMRITHPPQVSKDPIAHK